MHACAKTPSKIYSLIDSARDYVREAVTTLEDLERTARRVLGGAHPFTTAIERDLRNARAALSTRESS